MDKTHIFEEKNNSNKLFFTDLPIFFRTSQETNKFFSRPKSLIGLIIRPIFNKSDIKWNPFVTRKTTHPKGLFIEIIKPKDLLNCFLVKLYHYNYGGKIFQKIIHPIGMGKSNLIKLYIYSCTAYSKRIHIFIYFFTSLFHNCMQRSSENLEYVMKECFIYIY